MTLTEEGLRFKQRAQEIVRLADKAKEEFSKKGEVLSGKIAIGSGESHNVHLLTSQMAAFHRLYPEVRFDFYTAAADEVRDRLDKGLLDIGLLLEPVDIRPYHYVRLSEKEDWGVLVRSDSILAQKEAITRKDLFDIPLIIGRRPSIQENLANWFGEDFEQMTIVAEFDLLNNGAAMVRDGLGVVLCIDIGMRYDGLTFIPFKPGMQTGSVIVWSKSIMLSPAVRKFTEFLRNHYG